MATLGTYLLQGVVQKDCFYGKDNTGIKDWLQGKGPHLESV